jgi:hypothetical protein
VGGFETGNQGFFQAAQLAALASKPDLFARGAKEIELIEPVILDLERAGHKTGTVNQKGAFRLPAFAQAAGAKSVIG